MSQPTSDKPIVTATTTLTGAAIYAQVAHRLISGIKIQHVFQQLPDNLVRRNRASRKWVTIRRGKTERSFARNFESGVVFAPKFIHDAPDMCPSLETEYTSSGEAEGLVCSVIPEIMTIDSELFDTIVTVDYGSGHRFFHVAGDPRQVIESADLLILYQTGAASACRFRPGILSLGSEASSVT